MKFLKLHCSSSGVVYINAQAISSFFMGYEYAHSRSGRFFDNDEDEKKIPRTFVYERGDEHPYKVKESPEEIAAMLCDTKESPAPVAALTPRGSDNMKGICSRACENYVQQEDRAHGK